MDVSCCSGSRCWCLLTKTADIGFIVTLPDSKYCSCIEQGNIQECYTISANRYLCYTDPDSRYRCYVFQTAYPRPTIRCYNIPDNIIYFIISQKTNTAVILSMTTDTYLTLFGLPDSRYRYCLASENRIIPFKMRQQNQ